MTRQTSSSIKAKALSLLARREYTRAELEKKLLAWARAQAQKQNPSQTSTHMRQPVPQQKSAFDDYSFDDCNFDNYSFQDTEHEISHEGDHEVSASSTEQEISAALDALQTRGLLSDERALESLLHQKAHRFGINRLRQDMTSKGFDTATIQTTLEELKDSELERAHTAWQRKFKTPPLDASSYNKQARFLSYRGFSAETVRKVLEQVRKQNNTHQ